MRCGVLSQDGRRGGKKKERKKRKRYVALTLVVTHDGDDDDVDWCCRCRRTGGWRRVPCATDVAPFE